MPPRAAAAAKANAAGRQLHGQGATGQQSSVLWMAAPRCCAAACTIRPGLERLGSSRTPFLQGSAGEHTSCWLCKSCAATAPVAQARLAGTDAQNVKSCSRNPSFAVECAHAAVPLRAAAAARPDRPEASCMAMHLRLMHLSTSGNAHSSGPVLKFCLYAARAQL